MPNANYVRGRAAETKLVNQFKAQGWTAFRSAGSHGPYDVVAIPPNIYPDAAIQLIQVKSVKTLNRLKYYQKSHKILTIRAGVWDRIMILYKGSWY